MIFKCVCYILSQQEVDRGCSWYCSNLCFIHTQPMLNFYDESCCPRVTPRKGTLGKSLNAQAAARRGPELCPSGLKWLLSFCWIMLPWMGRVPWSLRAHWFIRALNHTRRQPQPHLCLHVCTDPISSSSSDCLSPCCCCPSLERLRTYEKSILWMDSGVSH